MQLQHAFKPGVSKRSVKHIALFRWKQGVTSTDVSRLFAEICNMKSVIPGIVDFVGGPYDSSEGLNDGFTHGFIMTFESSAARDAYLPHPEHERVKAVVVPHIERVVVFDFEE